MSSDSLKILFCYDGTKFKWQVKVEKKLPLTDATDAESRS